MDVHPLGGVLRYFDTVPDPRRFNVTYTLSQLLTCTLMAVLCRCDDYERGGRLSRGPPRLACGGVGSASRPHALPQDLRAAVRHGCAVAWHQDIRTIISCGSMRFDAPFKIVNRTCGISHGRVWKVAVTYHEKPRSVRGASSQPITSKPCRPRLCAAAKACGARPGVMITRHGLIFRVLRTVRHASS